MSWCAIFAQRKRLWLFCCWTTQQDPVLVSLSQQFTVDDLPNHPSSEVGHVFLWGAEVILVFPRSATGFNRINCLSRPWIGVNYLCECDWLIFGNVICIFACKHPAVAAVHLLWDFLRGKGVIQRLNCWQVQRRQLLTDQMTFVWIYYQHHLSNNLANLCSWIILFTDLWWLKWSPRDLQDPTSGTVGCSYIHVSNQRMM